MSDWLNEWLIEISDAAQIRRINLGPDMQQASFIKIWFLFVPVPVWRRLRGMCLHIWPFHSDSEEFFKLSLVVCCSLLFYVELSFALSSWTLVTDLCARMCVCTTRKIATVAILTLNSQVKCLGQQLLSFFSYIKYLEGRKWLISWSCFCVQLLLQWVQSL